MIEIINEEKEKEKRKDNLISHGVDEKETKVEDEKLANELVNQVDASPQAAGSVLEVIRLGKVVPGKTRPIKIVLKPNSGLKKKIFQSKENKQLGKNQNLKIVSDRTQKEREELKALYETLNERKSKGEKNLVIRNMQKVKLPDLGQEGAAAIQKDSSQN